MIRKDSMYKPVYNIKEFSKGDSNLEIYRRDKKTVSE